MGEVLLETETVQLNTPVWGQSIYSLIQINISSIWKITVGVLKNGSKFGLIRCLFSSCYRVRLCVFSFNWKLNIRNRSAGIADTTVSGSHQVFAYV